MFSPDKFNEPFQVATQFVNQTDRNIFLTGKAGTGKTTFLKFIRKNTHKKTVVAAPTGVAAINAGGVTLHSLFQLPFGPFIPTRSNSVIENAVNQNTLFRNMRFSNEKRELIRELELMIIDEVSMVRADMLDAVDAVLRHFRNRLHEPFGGVQVLFIGDLFQLPPVVKNEEWKLLYDYYESSFFFHSQVIRQSPPLYIELKKIYRQSETSFINILNNVRNNCTTEDDLNQLHKKYLPGFIAPESETYITLTTHNSKADEINQTKLRKLQGKLYEFKGEISGEFNENALPVELNLYLKEGAQIMFIKNDKGEIRRYYNGKLGTVKKISNGIITVTFPDGNHELELEKETWRNIRYHFNRNTDKLEEEELGTYTQYPIRLAWAITIHKSQGLTFDKAIIDAGSSFAAGQVYVALSRLTGMDGLILRSRIRQDVISTGEHVLDFSKSEMSREDLYQCLKQEQSQFIIRSLILYFNWENIVEEYNSFLDEYAHRQFPDSGKAMLWFKGIQEEVLQQQSVSRKFAGQLEQLIVDTERDNYRLLYQRVSAASDYFMKELDKIIFSLKAHAEEIKIKKRVKKYLKEVSALLLATERKKQKIKNAVTLAEALTKGTAGNVLLQLTGTQQPAEEQMSIQENAVTAKPLKGESAKISLQLFKEGKAIPVIAQERGYATSTIEGHLAGFVLTGEIDVFELMSAGKLEIILRAIDNHSNKSITYLKNKLGPDYSFFEIRAALNYKKRGDRLN